MCNPVRPELRKLRCALAQAFTPITPAVLEAAAAKVQRCFAWLCEQCPLCSLEQCMFTKCFPSQRCST